MEAIYYRGEGKSGWWDSNPRPPDPQSGALARLRYIPTHEDETNQNQPIVVFSAEIAPPARFQTT